MARNWIYMYPILKRSSNNQYWKVASYQCNTPNVAVGDPLPYRIGRLIKIQRSLETTRPWHKNNWIPLKIYSSACQDLCQISQRSDNSKLKSQGFESSRSYDNTYYVILN